MTKGLTTTTKNMNYLTQNVLPIYLISSFLVKFVSKGIECKYFFHFKISWISSKECPTFDKNLFKNIGFFSLTFAL